MRRKAEVKRRRKRREDALLLSIWERRRGEEEGNKDSIYIVLVSVFMLVAYLCKIQLCSKKREKASTFMHRFHLGGRRALSTLSKRRTALYQSNSQEEERKLITYSHIYIHAYLCTYVCVYVGLLRIGIKGISCV